MFYNRKNDQERKPVVSFPFIGRSNDHQWWNQVDAGWTAEQRYNFQLYGDPNGAVAYKINITTGHSVSTTGELNTITRKIDENGNIIQDRIYGFDGKAIKDIDYWHNEKPGSHFFPHEHYWDWTKKNPRKQENIWKQQNTMI